jgi:hypothetical protein
MIGFSTAAVILAAVASGQGAEGSNCAESVQRPIYPRLARIARMTGEAKASFVTGREGKPAGIDVTGGALFVNVVRSAIERTTLDPSCANREVNIRYRFQLQGEPSDEAHTTVTFHAPDEFVVTSNITGIICVLTSEPGKSRPPRVSKSSSRKK